MAKENNFTKAVKELLGERDNMDAEQGVTASKRKEDKASREEPAVNPAYMPPSMRTGERGSFISSATTNGATASKPTESGRQRYENESEQRMKQAVAPRTQESSAVTFINKDTVITGSITSKTDICNEGQVTGDIVTSENIWITGKVDGDLDGNMIQIIGGYVVGNIKAKADVRNDATSIILGDISGDNFLSDGKVKGNLKINNAVSLNNNAVVYGNVSARKLSVQDGAIIKGNVQIISPKNTDDDMFAVPRTKRAVPSDDDIFKIPTHPAVAALDEDDSDYVQQSYKGSSGDNEDLDVFAESGMDDFSDTDKEI